MKEIPLTQGKVALVDDEDYEWLSQWKWSYCKKEGYATRLCNRKRFYMHRVIMNTPTGMETDHKDRNGLNNKRDNLRICTVSQNHVNQPPSKINKTGYKGITFDKSSEKWRAQIKVNGKHITLGRYTTPEDAARVYDNAAFEYYGEFAYLNFGT